MGVSHSEPHPIETKWFNDYVEKLPTLEGKTVVITGTTSGTGNILAKLAVDKKAKNMLLLNRPSDRATKTAQALQDAAQGDTNVEAIDCDLQDFSSVQAAADAIKAKYDSVDVLCNNAGVMALEDKPTKKDGYDVQMQTNHLSHFLLTKELYPLLMRAKELRGQARVVNHSSGARHSPGSALEAKYMEKTTEGSLGGNGAGSFFNGPRWQRYHRPKLANAVFTKALADRFGDSGMIAAVAAPGLAATNLQVSTAQDGGMDWKVRSISPSFLDFPLTFILFTIPRRCGSCAWHSPQRMEPCLSLRPALTLRHRMVTFGSPVAQET